MPQKSSNELFNETFLKHYYSIIQWNIFQWNILAFKKLLFMIQRFDTHRDTDRCEDKIQIYSKDRWWRHLLTRRKDHRHRDSMAWPLLVCQASRQRLWWYRGLMVIILGFSHAILWLVTHVFRQSQISFLKRKQPFGALLNACWTDI